MVSSARTRVRPTEARVVGGRQNRLRAAWWLPRGWSRSTWPAGHGSVPSGRTTPGHAGPVTVPAPGLPLPPDLVTVARREGRTGWLATLPGRVAPPARRGRCGARG